MHLKKSQAFYKMTVEGLLSGKMAPYNSVVMEDRELDKMKNDKLMHYCPLNQNLVNQTEFQATAKCCATLNKN